ncbi:MAG: sugar phosphate nucleotidyltransferase [Coriobacteriales bacterium]|nr:sugar phosphate nucleotidyltransferase [Coriobacteriales bacterium]
MPSPFEHLYPVILCGGSDIRLWPLSRELAPRQLMTVTGENESLLAAATRRCVPLTDNPISVITDASLADEISSHLVGQDIISGERLNILTEPYPSGTAFSIALAAAYLAKLDPAAIMFVMPATHHIVEDDRWPVALTRAYRLACSDLIALIGTTPLNSGNDHPLIQPGHDIKGIVGASKVARYFAKPTVAQVNRVKRMGGLWDTGAFMTRASLILSELKRLALESGGEDPDSTQRIADTASFLAYVGSDHWNTEDAAQLVSTLPAVSFEQAVLQASEELGVIASTVEWSSISTLSELDELGVPGPSGNRTFGKTMPIDTSDSTIFSGGDRLVTTLGIKDALIVDTPDALLVAEKHALSQVPAMVNALKERKAPEVERAFVRPTPWGTVTTIRREGAFEVNRLQLHPKHHTPPTRDDAHQSQYTVISGKGTVRLDTHTKPVKPGDSFGVRAGVRTIITNTGDEPFVIMAVTQDVNADPGKQTFSAGSLRPVRKPLGHEKEAERTLHQAGWGIPDIDGDSEQGNQTPRLFL